MPIFSRANSEVKKLQDSVTPYMFHVEFEAL
jgi:hypothetical protein